MGTDTLVAQGGAGTGAADDVLSAIEAMPSSSKFYDRVELARTKGPSIVTTAVQRWASEGRQMPPTFLIFAGIDQSADHGVIWSVNLLTGTSQRFDGEFIAGTNTSLAQSVASAQLEAEYARHDPSFDRFATNVVAVLEACFPNDIGLPVQVGAITAASDIVMNMAGAGSPSDPAFAL